MEQRPVIIAGGLSFIAGALAFVSVFSYLAANFNYPGILDGSAAEVLPRLRAGGSVMGSSLSAVFLGLNLYLGNYIGEFLGEICLAFFFLVTGLSFVSESRFPKWLGWCGVVFASLFAIGAFRNVTSTVQPIADINNALLPLWMVVLGVSLIWYSRKS